MRDGNMQSFKSMLAPVLETERLRLELFDGSPEHYSVLLATANNPTAYALMGDLGVKTAEQFDALDRSARLAPATLGKTASELTVDAGVCYLFRIKDSDDGDSAGPNPLIGAVSLAQRSPRLPPDAGWCLLEAYHRRGYAPEAARKLVEYVRDQLGIAEVIAWPGETNEPSKRTAEKAGFVFGGTLLDDEGKAALVYMLPGMDFRKMQGETLSLWGESDTTQ